MNLFQQIDERIPTMDGWCSVEKAYVLASLVIALRPKISVELGVFGGRSAIPIALAHKHIKHGRLVAVDPWSNEAATEGYSDENKEWWGKQDLEGIMRKFQNHLHDLDLNEWVEVRRCKSDEVEPPNNAMLLHIDGQHSMQALRDAQRFTANMPVGSITVVDDVSWIDGGPAAAIKWMTENGWKELYPLDTGAVFQRIKPAKKSA